MTRKLQAGDICTRNVEIANRAMPLNEAARLMREKHIGCLVVVDPTDHGNVPVGMLTDRDIVTSVVAKDADPALISAGDAMSTELATAQEHDSVTEVLQTMSRLGVRRVPVTDARGALAGLVALDDLLLVMAQQLQLVAQAIENEQKREPSLRP